ncbi:hypothetical protein [[Flexibacter] sp. ATCC 35208]|uniref:hypothetical protein n=1 Tax=[Flexibacter] sp. ATCC 35208 TaxID=1936242 RepID=UPI0015C33BC8|nr:hypothetical protein [[Flexibacter] sp. ATCC 35208]
MEKKVIKYWSDIFKTEITMTVDERLNKIDEENISSKELQIANEQLSKIKDFLPKR